MRNAEFRNEKSKVGSSKMHLTNNKVQTKRKEKP
jgi:hypothetical protein